MGKTPYLSGNKLAKRRTLRIAKHKSGMKGPGAALTFSV
jgi:hypothetical protein